MPNADVFLVPFTILWGGFAMVWESAAILSGSPFFMLFGIPFVFVGLYLLAGRFLYKAYRKRRTVHAVTDRRVMTIYQGRGGETVEATYLRAIPSISTTSDSQGRGNIEFGNTLPAVARYANTGMWLPFAGGGGFYDIDDPGGVADLVERLREQAGGDAVARRLVGCRPHESACAELRHPRPAENPGGSAPRELLKMAGPAGSGCIV